MKWLIKQWENFENTDSDIWINWLEPRLNVFTTISVHRYYVHVFIKEYLQEYFKVPVDQLLNWLQQEEEYMSKLKYLCFKLSVSRNGKRILELKENVKNLLKEIDMIELQISKLIVNNLHRKAI